MADEKIFVEAVDGGAKNFFICPQAAGRSGYHAAIIRHLPLFTKTFLPALIHDCF